MRAAVDGLVRTQPDSTQVGRLRAYLCLVRLAKQDVVGARAECAASLRALRAVAGPDSPHEIWTLTLSGQVELADHRFIEAVTFLERAAALAVAGNVRSIEAATAQGYYAIALLRAKRTTQARAVAVKIAPALRAAELAETRREFVQAFPELTQAATPSPP